MNYSDYQDFIVQQVNEVTGLDLEWNDFTLSNPIPIEGKTIEVTIAPTEQGAMKFEGEARFKIDRMVLDNEEYVFDWIPKSDTDATTVRRFSVDLALFDESPKTLEDVCQLLTRVLDVEFKPEDFEDLTVRPDAYNDVTFEFTAASRSLYYYGTLQVRLTHPWINQIDMVCQFTEDTTVNAAQVANGKLVVDGEAVTLPYTIPAGIRKLLVIGFDSTAKWCTPLNPLELVSLRLFYGTYRGLFEGSTTLTKIHSESILLGSQKVSVPELFKGCENLKTLPSSMFAANSSCGDISYLFSESGITKVGGSLFKNLTMVNTQLTGIFQDCTRLATVHPNTLTPLGNSVTRVDSVFAGTALTEIPNGLFDGFPNVTTMTMVFLNCLFPTTIPEDLFVKQTKVTMLLNVFNSCSGLTDIPVGLFRNQTALTTTSGLFAKCTSLLDVPEDLFANCTNMLTMDEVFFHSDLLELPPKLLSKMRKLSDMTSAFAGTGIEVVPEGFFDNNPTLDTIQDIFSGCTGLVTISNEAFANCDKLTNVSGAFMRTAIGIDMTSEFFPGSDLKKARSVFEGSNIGYLPEGLFAAHTNLTVASRAFANTHVVEVPSNLFKVYNAAIDFEELFSGCVELTTVKEDAIVLGFSDKFQGSVAGMFAGCGSLVDLKPNAVRISGHVTSIASFMSGCSNLRYSTTELLERIVFNTKPLESESYYAYNSFAGCIWLTGKAMDLFNAMSNNRKITPNVTTRDFCEHDWLLDDYQSIGSRWWTSPINLDEIKGPIDVFHYADVDKGIQSYVPLYATFNLNVDGALFEGLEAAVNVGMYDDLYAKLTPLFFAVGLKIPKDAERHSLNRLDNPTEDQAALLRPEVKRAIVLTFNRYMGSVTDALRRPDTYVFCSLT